MIRRTAWVSRQTNNDIPLEAWSSCHLPSWHVASIVSIAGLMLQYWSPFKRVLALGRCVMVAQRTLNPYVLVRFRAPQLDPRGRVLFVLDEDSSIYIGSRLGVDEPHLLEERCVGARCFFS